MRTARILVLVCLTGCALLAGCGSYAPVAAPRSAAACPPVPVLTEPPRRIVTMDGGAAAIVAALGFADRIVGTSGTDFFAPFGPRQRAELGRIPVLDRRSASTEKVLEARPDLVVGTSSLSFGGFDGTPTPDVLAGAGIKALVACQTQPSPVRDLSQTTRFLTEVAAVLGVPSAGQRLVARLRADSGISTRPVGDPKRVLVLTRAPLAGTPVSTRGGGTLVNGVVAAAGGRNIAEDVPSAFAGLSAEEIARRDPQAIVVLTGFTDLPDETLLGAVRASPLLAGTTAVREDRLAVVPASIALTPSVLNGQAVRVLAELLNRPAA